MRILMAMAVAATLAAPAAAAPDAMVESYARSVIGSFDTRAQHAIDARYGIVEAVVARLWADDPDGAWLYQEQAVIDQAGKTEAQARATPYFQRIGHVVRTADSRLHRDNYVIVDPARFVGLGRPGYAGPVPTRADLGKAGCANQITLVATDHFTATTDRCSNSYRDAATMLSLAITTPDTFVNWDRGFDAAGRVVWGPADGGYVFRRR